jgi:hypothetical protein
VDSKTRGIYSITCLLNGKVYIGSSVFIEKRFQRHRQMLTKNVIEREKAWIDELGSCNKEKGFNVNPNPGRPPMEGKKHTPETLRKLSINSKKPWTPERLENHQAMIRSNVGKGKYGSRNSKEIQNASSLRNKGMLLAFADGELMMTFTTASEARKEGYFGIGEAIRKGQRSHGFEWRYLKTDLRLSDGF